MKILSDNILTLNGQYNYADLDLRMFRAIPDFAEKIQEHWNTFFEAENNRFNEFTKLLLKVWKVRDDNGPFCYLYPYRAIEANRCIFCLKCDITRFGAYHTSGIEDFTIHTDDWNLFSDLDFEETTMEKMIEYAKDSVDMIVHDRLIKLKERGVLTDDLKPTGKAERDGDMAAKLD